MASILVGATALTIDKIKSKRAERKAAQAGDDTHSSTSPTAAALEKQREAHQESKNGHRGAEASSRPSTDAPPPAYHEHR